MEWAIAVSIPLIGSNLFKLDIDMFRELFAITFQSPKSGQICLNVLEMNGEKVSKNLFQSP